MAFLLVAKKTKTIWKWNFKGVTILQYFFLLRTIIHKLKRMNKKYTQMQNLIGERNVRDKNV